MGTRKLSGLESPGAGRSRLAGLVASGVAGGMPLVLRFGGGPILAMCVSINEVDDALRHRVGLLVERCKPGFSGAPSLVEGAAIGHALGHCLGDGAESGLADVALGFGQFCLAVADAAEGNGELAGGNSLLCQFLGQHDRWFEVVEREATRQYHDVAGLRDAERASRRVRRAVQYEQVVMVSHAQSLLD